MVRSPLASPKRLTKQNKQTDSMPILKNKNVTSTKTETPAPSQKATPKVDVFAQKFAEADSSKSGFVQLPPGDYNAFITSAEAIQKDLETSMYFGVTVVDPENPSVHGKEFRVYFNFTDDKGEEKGGMPFFKKVCEMLGLDEPFTSWAGMVTWLAELVEADPKVWVLIESKKKGKYTNIYISEVPEDQSEAPGTDDLPL